MIGARILALWSLGVPVGEGPAGHGLNRALDPDTVRCDSVDGARIAEARTKAAKRDTRARVQTVCRALRMSKEMCVFFDVIVCRESWCGVTTARHRKGPTEHGLGPMGLSLKWHANKWPGDDEDPMFCVPEVSAAVAAAIIRAAYYNYGAVNFTEVQAIYAGKFYKNPDTGKMQPRQTHGRAKAICRRLERRGVDCWRKLSRKEFGRRVRTADRRVFVDELLKAREGDGA